MLGKYHFSRDVYTQPTALIKIHFPIEIVEELSDGQNYTTPPIQLSAVKKKKKKMMMDAMDIQAVESKLNDVTVTAIPMTSASQHQYPQHHNQQHQQLQITNKMQLTQQQIKQLQQLQQQQQPQNLILPTQHSAPTMDSTTTRVSADITTPFTSVNSIPSSVNSSSSLSKYAQLLAVIEEMGRDIRPTYSGSRSSAERLKRGIVHARILVRECLVETERSARQ